MPHKNPRLRQVRRVKIAPGKRYKNPSVLCSSLTATVTTKRECEQGSVWGLGQLCPPPLTPQCSTAPSPPLPHAQPPPEDAAPEQWQRLAVHTPDLVEHFCSFTPCTKADISVYLHCLVLIVAFILAQRSNASLQSYRVQTRIKTRCPRSTRPWHSSPY